MLQATIEEPEVWVATVTSELISWWQRETGVYSGISPTMWLVDVAGRSPPHWGGSAEVVGQTLTQLGLTNLLLNKPLWAFPLRPVT